MELGVINGRIGRESVDSRLPSGDLESRFDDGPSPAVVEHSIRARQKFSGGIPGTFELAFFAALFETETAVIVGERSSHAVLGISREIRLGRAWWRVTSEGVVARLGHTGCSGVGHRCQGSQRGTQSSTDRRRSMARPDTSSWPRTPDMTANTTNVTAKASALNTLVLQ